MKTRIYLFFIALLLFSQLGIAQLKVESGGKISVGTVHTLDNGRLKIGNDGNDQGISFYNSCGTDGWYFRENECESHAQDFLTPDKIWSDYYADPYHSLYDEDGKFLGWTTAEITTWYKVGTDSLIEGKTYKQILQSTDANKEKWEFAALMREEGKKIYLREEKESLLYDFGMQTGDTLFDSYGDSYIATVLQSVRDTLLDDNTLHKVFVFSRNPVEYPDWTKEEIWIEGIGTMQRGLFRHTGAFSTGDERDYSLLCFFYRGCLIYHNPEKERCYYRIIGGVDGIPVIKSEQSVLAQNTPNPFTNQTEIKYFVAPGVKNAYIYIFDMQGKLLQKINAATGQNSVTVQGSTLQAGIYLYSLVADGREVDTKRMILTR
ncbi:hypothetical protein FACS189451_05370 [Bacteroidia bacterium]|nr:hypothetical protein FACS189451_05370 [Bacteroidia bacterium]